jgi:hypothetical protein
LGNKGINDIILKKEIDLQNRAIGKIKEITKGTDPFAAEKVSDEDILHMVNTIDGQDMLQLVTEFGADSVNQLVSQAKLYEMKKYGGQNASSIK